MIDSTIYSRLNDSSITSIVSTRIFNSDPTENPDWPYLVYRLSAGTPMLTLGGTAGITTYEVTVEMQTKSVQQRNTLADAVKGRLHVWRGLPVQLSRLVSEESEQIGDEEEGDRYVATQVYALTVNG